MPALCRACQLRPAPPRYMGTRCLCRPCWLDPAIRAQHPPIPPASPCGHPGRRQITVHCPQCGDPRKVIVGNGGNSVAESVSRRLCAECCAENQRGVSKLRDDFYGHAPMPTPTPYPPGTPEKVAELERRAKERLSLFHPRDAEGAT